VTVGKMTPKRAKAVIDAAFMNLSHAAESRTDPERYVQKAFEAAFADEKHHREQEWVPTERPRSTLKTVARYFVVKWYLDPAVIRNAAEALALRQDCLYASAVRVLLGDVPSVMKLAAEFETIDYKDHLSAPAKA
jgi:predicted RNA polymerase sigma factor